MPNNRPNYRAPRALLRAELMPNLRAMTARPTVAPTTMTEVSDTDLGLPNDPVAQAQAERFVRAAIAFKRHLETKAERVRRAFKPINTRIAVPSDDDDDESPPLAAVDVLLAEKITPRSWADEGH